MERTGKFKSRHRVETLSGGTAIASWLFACIFAVCRGVDSANAQVPCRYEVAHIIQAPGQPPFGSPSTIGVAISPNGRYVVGSYHHVFTGIDDAFYFDTITAQFTTIPRPAGVERARAEGVNDAGMVAGSCFLLNGPQRGFVYDIPTGVWTELAPTFGGVLPRSTAVAINNAGQVTGTRSIGQSDLPETAYVWSAASGFTDLGLVNGHNSYGEDINEAGTVAITGILNNVLLPYLWQNGEIMPLGSLKGLDTRARAINNENVVVGSSFVPASPQAVMHAFRWENGAMIDLGTLPGHTRSRAEDVSNNGVIVGLSRLPNQQDRGFRWHNGIMQDLNALTDNLNGLVITEAGAINSSEQIVAFTLIKGSSATLVLQPIDSPVSDLDGNCRVDVNDLLLLIGHWGSTGPGDLDGDGYVGVEDLVILLEEWSS